MNLERNNPTGQSLRPGMAVPGLIVELLDGSTYDIASTHPERFTMIIFFRGHFCGVCKQYLPEVQKSAAEFTDHGVEIVLISCDSQLRSEKIRDDWGVTLPIGHSLDLQTAQAWNLFLTQGDPERPEMPEVFSEPGLYLIAPDHTIFFTALSTSPVGRPAMSEMHGWLKFMEGKNDFPVRGNYVPTHAATAM